MTLGGIDLNRIVYKGLIKIKNSVIVVPVVNYIKTKHPGFWLRLKNRLLIPKTSSTSALNVISDGYTQNFVNRLVAEIEYRERLGR